MAGITALINSCQSKNSPSLSLVKVISLDSFPSASALEYHAEKIYVFGDDASYLLVLDTNFKTVQKEKYITDSSYRIQKEIKPDVESATIIEEKGKPVLFAFGSLSGDYRKRVYVFSLDSLKKRASLSLMHKNMESIKEWNVEGAAFVKGKIVFANRANTSTKINYLVNAFLPKNGNSIETGGEAIRLRLPETELVAGVSGLYYVETKDLLLFTASEENTPDAISDGAIGESYLGLIKNFSQTRGEAVKPDVFLKLSEAHPSFQKQKVESVCVQEVTKKGLILLLAVDNDNGRSTLFKVALQL